MRVLSAQDIQAVSGGATSSGNNIFSTLVGGLVGFVYLLFGKWGDLY